MPLLLVAILTHIIYKAVSNGLDWGGEASRKAWGASLAHSRSVSDRLRQRMQDTLDSWDQDPRGRRYAATGVRMAMGTGRLLGRLGVGAALMGAKGAGAVARGLAGGALATGGLLGALAQSVRSGVRGGSEWWRTHHNRKGWRWANWFPEQTEETADKWWRWGDTIPGETGPDPYDEYWEDDPRPWPDPEAEPAPAQEPEDDPGPWPDPEADPAPAQEPVDPDPSATPEPERPKPIVVEWGDPLDERVEDPTIFNPTPVTSGMVNGRPDLYTATAVLDRPRTTDPALEGEVMTTDVTPSQGNAVAPVSNPADGMKYEQSLAFLAEQERRARELSAMMEQLQALQLQICNAAAQMAADHSTAEAALARFRIQAPNVAESVNLLTTVANPAPAEQMVTTFMALDAVANGCQADATDLTTRFGPSWEAMKAENADAEYLND